MAVAVPQFEIPDRESFDSLFDSVEQLAGLERMTKCASLPFLRALVAEQANATNDGCRPVASALSMRLGCAYETSIATVNVAVATATLPCALAAFVEGSLSWDKLVLVCRFATPETDEQFAQECPAMTIRMLRRLARAAERDAQEKATDVHTVRMLKLTPTRDGLAMRIEGYVPIEGGAIVRKRLEDIGNSLGPDENGNYLPSWQLNADALVELCASGPSSFGASDSASVVIHADVSTLRGLSNAEIEGDGIITPEQLRRILCSASVEAAIMDSDGRTIGSGRKTRLFPPKVLREIKRRDCGCRFPGCQRRRWLDGHHVQEWGKGGPSDEDNGIALCNHHHKYVHDFGWRIEGSVYGLLTFIAPDGREFTGIPPAVRPEIAALFPFPEAG